MKQRRTHPYSCKGNTRATVKEQNIKIEEQQHQIDELKSLIQSLSKQTANSTINSLGFIKQNSPNPASGNTVISYYVHNNTRNAVIIVSDIKGRLLKNYRVLEGDNQVSIKNGELPSGTYNYSLYVN